ncbi:hypothetical protein [Haloplanus halobius]|uniref:hypothetical protein n=1 Tax=Haloplanus halobius TaxID=2934938 RepID=UPI00200C066A|nr:hypothetical protein [Haloplanus sp. XH21]
MSPSRRSLLAGVATVLAGCNAPDDSTATPTGTDHSDTDAAISTARRHLRDALSAYVEHAGPGATLLDITATSEGAFTPEPVVNACRAANEAIRKGRRNASGGQQQTLDQLAAASVFLRESATLQHDLRRAADALADLRRVVYRDEMDPTRTERSPVERVLEESNAHADIVTAQDPAAVASVLDALDEATVRSKRTQFGAEDRQLWDLSSVLLSVLSGTSALGAGWTAWREEAFDDATHEFRLAVEDFGSAAAHLDEAWTAAFRTFGAQVTDVVDALQAGSQRLHDAAVAMTEGRSDAADRNRDRARAALRENETVVEEIRAVQPILDGE